MGFSGSPYDHHVYFFVYKTTICRMLSKVAIHKIHPVLLATHANAVIFEFGRRSLPLKHFGRTSIVYSKP